MSQRTPARSKRQRLRTQSRNHSVYVVELDVAALRGKASSLPPVYVGMTGLAPEARFVNHKKGHKASRIVRKHGVRLLPALYTHLNPMTYQEALLAEIALANALRERGLIVFGGH